MASSTLRINQYLAAGTHRMLIVDPFDTRIVAIPENPSPGFQFLADTDSATEV